MLAPRCVDGVDLKLVVRWYLIVLRQSEPNEAAALDNIERRFAWFRRMFTRHEAESAKVFPLEWKVGWALVGAFVDCTK